MSSPVRRSRRNRVDTAYRYTMATGVFGVAAAVAFVLALITSFSWGWFVLLAAIAAVSAVLLRSSMR
jgi:flagellar biosynthesis component FlhA